MEKHIKPLECSQKNEADVQKLQALCIWIAKLGFQEFIENVKWENESI